MLGFQVEPGEERIVHPVETAPKDQLQPKLHRVPYRKPGDRIDRPLPRLFDVARKRQVPIDDAPFADASGRLIGSVRTPHYSQVMRALAVSVASLLAAAASAPVCAQEVRLKLVEPKFAAAKEGTLEWFQLGFEVIEAQLDYDARAAVPEAARLRASAEGSTLLGVGQAAAAMTALVVCIVDGPVYAEPWLKRSELLPDGTNPVLRYFVHLARTRVLCHGGKHDQEVLDWVQARELADQLGDPLLRIRSLSVAGHITPERGLVMLRKLFAQAVERGRQADIEHLRYLCLIEEQAIAGNENRFSEAARLAEQIEQLAATQGNRRLHASAMAARANSLYRRGERDAAMPIYEEVERLYEKLGDRRALFGIRDMLVWSCVHREDYATVQLRLAELTTLIEGAGYAECDLELVRTRFEIAVRMHDGDNAATYRNKIDEMQTSNVVVERRAEELRERVATTERAKEAAEERLAAENSQAAQRLDEARRFGTFGLVGSLTLLVLVSFWSRRKLLVANARLADHVREIEAGKLAQQKLEERMRELERTESLGTMAAGVAHDFNNLLTSILGSAELMQQPGGRADGVELARAIQSASEQASRLCRQLQAYAGGSPTQCVPVDLVAIVTEMLPALQAATKNTVSVTLAVAPDLIGVGALGDRAQLEQVLLNLVTNARDANAHSVRISLSTPPATAEGGSEALIVVTDDGDGMTAEVQQRIFDPFFTTRFPGRGLGLAVVHGVVRRHSGRIAVQSAPGQGSTFTITLPCATAPKPPIVVPRPPTTISPNSLRSMFVVDDDLAVRGMLARMLSTIGVQAQILDSGEALFLAVAALPKEQQVTAFVDLSMPGLDGVEVVRRLRSMRASSRVVLMSGHPASYVEQVAGDMQLDGVLSKPFMIEAVRTLVQQLCAEDGARGETVASDGSDRR